jgi:ElaB/YqjD/DUF883 family membrane-anchored ribosome-binding protein
MSDYETNHRMEDNRGPEEIESDLERTRAEVSSTIDAIQSKLTPGQMMDQAVAYARTSLPADFGVNLASTVRDNPVPVALMGVGIAWLMASSRSSGSGASVRRRPAYDDDYDSRRYDSDLSAGGTQGDKLHRATAAASEKGSELKDRISATSHNAIDKASELGHRISDSASSVADRARNATGNVRDRISDTAASARARIGDLSHLSQDQYYRAKDGFSRMLDEQPLMVGVLGLAAGALLGAALPNTRREDRMLGRTRDDLLDKAKEVAGEQAERVKESARHVADVAKEEVKSMAADVAPGARKNASFTTGASATDTSAANRSNVAARPERTQDITTGGAPASGRQTSSNVKRDEQYDEIPVDEAHM